jgi:hypothetical protein
MSNLWFKPKIPVDVAFELSDEVEALTAEGDEPHTEA